MLFFIRNKFDVSFFTVRIITSTIPSGHEERLQMATVLLYLTIAVSKSPVIAMYKLNNLNTDAPIAPRNS